MWLTAADKHVEYAEEIYSVTELVNGRSIQLLCTTKRIRSRGDTLNCPTLTIKLEAEFDGVISFEVWHLAGTVRAKPEYELFPDGRPVQDSSVIRDQEGTRMESGRLAVVVGPDSHSFDIRFKDAHTNQEITSLSNRSVGFAINPPPGNAMQLEDLRDFKHYVFTQTELTVGESVHGLGERFGPFNKLGQNVQIWNADG
jgi:alpha-D-xyloside xylohydrolase